MLGRAVGISGLHVEGLDISANSRQLQNSTDLLLLLVCYCLLVSEKLNKNS